MCTSPGLKKQSLQVSVFSHRNYFSFSEEPQFDHHIYLFLEASLQRFCSSSIKHKAFVLLSLYISPTSATFNNKVSQSSSRQKQLGDSSMRAHSELPKLTTDKHEFTADSFFFPQSRSRTLTTASLAFGCWCSER